jgi:cytidine deaminase
MLEPIIYTTQISRFESLNQLSIDDQLLINKAKHAAEQAYAPYSNFQVGAAVLLSNGEIITGNNQENVAYPSGLCAERTAVFYASSQFPDQAVVKIAIAATSKLSKIDQPVYPCGSCRQALVEYEMKFKQPIKVYMTGESGEVHVCESIASLLPSYFEANFLKKG